MPPMYRIVFKNLPSSLYLPSSFRMARRSGENEDSFTFSQNGVCTICPGSHRVNSISGTSISL